MTRRFRRRPLLRAAVLAAALAGAACAEGRAGARTHVLDVRNFAYQPAAVTVAVGDTLAWTNHDLVPHTATAADGAWDTGGIGAGESGRIVVRRSGRQQYVCAYHPGMRAEVVARE